jgi:ABC-type transporter Mla MlaB component
MMLRITIHNDPESITVQLEGGLAGRWVQELQDCWQRTLSANPKQSVRFDLTEVTFVDASGKEFLTARYHEGHEFVAAGCLMKSLVAEIIGLPMLVRRLPVVENKSVS